MKGSVTSYTTVFTTARFLYEIGHTSSHFEFSMLPPMASATTNGPGRDRTIGSSMEDSESIVIASPLCARSGICQKQTHGSWQGRLAGRVEFFEGEVEIMVGLAGVDGLERADDAPE